MYSIYMQPSIDWLLLHGKETLCYLPIQRFYLLLLLFCPSIRRALAFVTNDNSPLFLALLIQFL